MPTLHRLATLRDDVYVIFIPILSFLPFILAFFPFSLHFIPS